jgi:hypothetical protein
MNGNIRILAERPFYGRQVRLLFIAENERGETYRVMPLVWQKMEDNDPLLDAGNDTACLRWKEAQQLMDELWRCGVRPSSGEGNTGELQATQKHLDDMRKQSQQLLNHVLRPPFNITEIPPGTPGPFINPFGDSNR